MKPLNQQIRTQRVILRKYIEADKEKFSQLFTDKEVNHYMGGPHCETKQEALELFEKGLQVYNGLFPGRHFEIWAIEFQNELIGHFELKQSENTEGDELEIVYLLDKDYWGKGLMPEIIKKINEYAQSIGKQLIATLNPENTKTVRALEKVGIERSDWIVHDDEKTFKVWIERVIV